MAINVQKPHEIAPLIGAQARKHCAELLGAVVRRERLRPRRSVFTSGARSSPRSLQNPAGSRSLSWFGPLDAQQGHEHERQQRRAQAIEGRTDFTIKLVADPK